MPGSPSPTSPSPPAGDDPDALWRLGACTCAHCGSPRVHNEDPAQIYGYAGVTATLLLCMDCGGRFSHPLPTPELLAKLYKDPGVFNYRWYQEHYPAKLLDAFHRVVQYRRRGLLHGRVLDFGGGPGYFSRAARFFGHPAETRDPYYESSGAATATGPRQADDEPFDTVVCHHVLEHIPDLDAGMRQILGLLKPGGLLLAAVPNGESRGYRRLGHGWVWSQPPFVHVHHFTGKGLASVLARHGLVEEQRLYFERWDANAVSDVALVERFRHWDAGWGRSRWSYGQAQVNTLRRYLALLASTVTGAAKDDERAELLIVARRPGAPA